MANNPSFQDEQAFAAALKGVDFPTQRDGIIEQARKNGASEDVIKRLSALRDGDFGNAAEVLDASNNP